MTLPTTEPTSFAAGETLKWRKSLANYLASAGWALSYKFRGAGAGFDVTAVAVGDDFEITVLAEQTSALVGGQCWWEAWVTKAGETYRVEAGQATVSPALPDKGLAYDGRSQVKRILDAIDALIAGKATLDQQEYQIGDRQLRRIPIADLILLRKTYAQLYNQEQQAARLVKGGPFFKTVLTRFTTPE